MPNTRADLKRLNHHWEGCDHPGEWSGNYTDELFDIADRLLTERGRAQVAEKILHINLDDMNTLRIANLDSALRLEAEVRWLKEGIEQLLSEAHVIQDRDEDHDVVTLSKVVHAARLAALLTPDETTKEGETP